MISDMYRIVSANQFGIGRIEVKHNGKWGTVCNDDFNYDAGAVFCQSLGLEAHECVYFLHMCLVFFVCFFLYLDAWSCCY